MRTTILISFSLLLLLTGNFYAQTVSEQYISNWSDPEVQERIETGIEMNRKDWANIKFVNEDGKATQWDGTIQIKQTTHDFLFGANIFMLDGYEDDEKNEKYKDAFRNLLNYATVPFYWKSLEPEKGNVRFSKDSRHIHRRPAPDICVEFCKKNNITMKGHPIMWDVNGHGIPSWLPQEEDSREYYIEKRTQEIGERYRDDITHWDVVNETNSRGNRVDPYSPKYVPIPDDYAIKTFQMAEKYFRSYNHFTYNFTTGIWSDYAEEYGLEYILSENLILKDAKVDAIGFQCHIVRSREWNQILNGEFMTPLYMMKFLDLFAQLNRPIQITEITFPSTIPEGEEGEKNQARITRDWYRLWFSHPNVEAITWWNVSDGSASNQIQNQLNGGFLDDEINPKPAYEVLDELINHEWNTQITETIANQSSYKFKGFYGEYEIILSKDGEELKRANIHIEEGSYNDFQFRIPE